MVLCLEPMNLTAGSTSPDLLVVGMRGGREVRGRTGCEEYRSTSCENFKASKDSRINRKRIKAVKWSNEQ